MRTRRRRLMMLVAGSFVGASPWSSDHVSASASAGQSSGEASPNPSDGFDPTVHGFGFPNWEGDTGTAADGEEFTYESGDVSREEVGRALDDSWTTTFSEAQRTLLSRIVYSWIAGRAATNGHCYGMAFAADHYVRNPSELPGDVDVASEIPHPTGEYDDVGARIRWFHTSQLLRAESYWFAFLGLRWGLGDHRESLEQITDTIDETGTSGVGLSGAPIAHQVLAHDYERADGVTKVSVYDPTYEADDHADGVWTLSVDSETGDVHEIADGYDTFIHHDPDADLSTVDALVGGRDRVVEKLSNAVFLGLESGGSLEVDVPEDVLVDRPAAEYADSDGTRYADAAVVLGPIEAFEITIDGGGGGEYSLDTLGTRDGDLVLEEVVADTLEEVPTRLRFAVDETGEFVVDVVEEVEDEAEEGAEAVGEAAGEAGEAAEDAGEAVGEDGETAVDGSAADPEGENDGLDWVEDNWLVAVAGGALGLGAAYRLVARRIDREDGTE